jgi:4-hydroxyproline epimerase
MSHRPPVVVVDSHTEGEPTRTVIEGGPVFRAADLAGRALEMRERFDAFRAAVVCEPRGSDAVVGALLTEPVDPAAAFGVIFFNNVSTLGMCGHGTIGVVRTLAHLGRIQPGPVVIETPPGLVRAELHPDGRVSFLNVPSYRYRTGVVVEVAGLGRVTGDVAYGGNWFFLVQDHGLEIQLANLDALTRLSTAIRHALEAQGITGEDGAEIDHIELVGPARQPSNDARNFVLCPGLAYDRSPCGTGTSAKLACLHADGKLRPGQTWRQESVIGSLFEGEIAEVQDDAIVPRITGRAYITAEATLVFDPSDPFRDGIVA